MGWRRASVRQGEAHADHGVEAAPRSSLLGKGSDRTRMRIRIDVHLDLLTDSGTAAGLARMSVDAYRPLMPLPVLHEPVLAFNPEQRTAKRLQLRRAERILARLLRETRRDGMDNPASVRKSDRSDRTMQNGARDMSHQVFQFVPFVILAGGAWLMRAQKKPSSLTAEMNRWKSTGL